MTQHKNIKVSIAIVAILLLTINYHNMKLKTIPLPNEARVIIEINNNIKPKYVVPLKDKTELQLVRIYTSLTETEAEAKLKKQSWIEIVNEERGNNVKIP